MFKKTLNTATGPAGLWWGGLKKNKETLVLAQTALYVVALAHKQKEAGTTAQLQSGLVAIT